MSSEDTESLVEDAQNAINDVRARLAEVPAETVVVNHVMGLYELAAIHLGSEPPRLGPDAPTLVDALSNIRLAFVQIKAATHAAQGE